MSDFPSAALATDLGVPAARNARIYALVGLVITAAIGLFVWDMLGIVFGAPFAFLGLVRGARSFGRTEGYPSDRRAAITAIVAALATFGLWIPIVISAMK